MSRPLAGKAYCYPGAPLAWFVCVHVGGDGFATFVGDDGNAVTFGPSACADMAEVGEGDRRDEAVAKVVSNLWRSRRVTTRRAS